jgi:hypothetical protein
VSPRRNAIVRPQGRAAAPPAALASKELATKELSTRTSGFREIHASKGSYRA